MTTYYDKLYDTNAKLQIRCNYLEIYIMPKNITMYNREYKTYIRNKNNVI